MIVRRNLIAAFMPLLVAVPGTLIAQDDATTQNGPNAMHGAWITGPASNPLSFLNGPAYRTFGSKMPYDIPDFRPPGQWDARLPRWINLEAEEWLRLEGYTNGSFKPGNDDSYWLNRFRFQIDLRLNRRCPRCVLQQLRRSDCAQFQRPGRQTHRRGNGHVQLVRIEPSPQHWRRLWRL